MRESIVVLISVYKSDNPEHLKLAFDSILNQTFEDIKVLIGVDGSVGEKLGRTIFEYETNPKVKIT